MHVPDRRLALAYRLVAAVLMAWGIGRVTGILDGRPSAVEFLYYTVLSNLLCLVWMVVLVVRTVADLRAEGPRGASTPSARFSLAVAFAITVTMLIYLIVLVPETFTQGNDYQPFTLTDNLIHIITPALAIADWLLFVPKGRSRWFDPPLWTLIPYAYLAFAFVYGAAGGRFGSGGQYPYPFMNLDRHGLGGVVLWIVGLTLALEVVAYVYVLIDKGLGMLARRMRRTAPPRRGGSGRRARLTGEDAADPVSRATPVRR